MTNTMKILMWVLIGWTDFKAAFSLVAFFQQPGGVVTLKAPPWVALLGTGATLALLLWVTTSLS